jgi:trimeric autotransporter adhesin
MGHHSMKKLFGLSALVSPRVVLGVGLVLATTLFGGTGCGLSYSLTGIYVEPASNATCVYNGATAQFKAYGTYTEGNHAMRVEDISSQVKWAVTLPDLASISTSGLATANSDGVTGLSSIVASTTGEFGYLAANSSLQVSTACTVPAIARSFSLNIVPRSQNLTVGQTLQPLAIATYGIAGRTADLSQQVTWESSDTKIATVDAKGVITAVGAGDATITALSKTPSGEVVSATQTIHLENQ